MAEKNQAPKAPAILEAATRAELVKTIGDYVTKNPGTKVSCVQFDEYKDKPFWVDITNSKA